MSRHFTITQTHTIHFAFSLLKFDQTNSYWKQAILAIFIATMMV